MLNQPLAHISYLIARIDALVSKQIDEILHHSRLKTLEASWRGIAELSVQASKNVVIRLLDAKFPQVEQDIQSKLEFDQTHLFEKIYSAEFGMPGGEPYSLLIGDYYFNIKKPQHVSMLNGISQIAAAAFVPFITSIHLDSLNVESYAMLLKAGIKNLALIDNYQGWQRFRRCEDACFVGFLLPKILIRRSYTRENYTNTYFQYQETLETAEDCIWGHPAYMFALNVVHCFKQTSWFDDLHKYALYFVPSWKQTEFFIDHKTETMLNNLGVMVLTQRGYSQNIYSNSACSVQIAKNYDTDEATVNAKIAGLLKYIFCVSRFAHYVKVIARDKIGSFHSSEDFEFYLNQWIGQYVAANDVPEKIKPVYPLKYAQIIVTDKPGKYTNYHCIIRLMPRLDLESVNFSLQLVTVIGEH